MTGNILESPEDVLSTMDKDGQRLWIYPSIVKGYFFRLRKIVGWALIFIYLAIPHILVNEKPLLQIDFIHGRLYLWGQLFRVTDNIYLLLFGFCVAFSLILFTAVLGRVWCGWACPQTVYLEFFYRPVEEFFEGSAEIRRRRDRGPWTWDKTWRKTGKYLVYFLFSFLLANTFLAYFVGSASVLSWMQQSPTEQLPSFLLVMFVTGLMMFDFCYFREQMCTIACPYARLQSVMLDRDSLIVAYDQARGEPRGRGRLRESLGDCVDCGLCVRVCPTGIDIRQGLQMECLHCTQCIDACDSVMLKVGKPAGLIRYASLNSLEGNPLRVFRTRTAIYLALLLLAFFSSIYLIASRPQVEVTFLRHRSSPYTRLSGGKLSNQLLFVLTNQRSRPMSYEIAGQTAPDVSYILPQNKFTLEPYGSKEIAAFVIFSETKLSGVDPYARLLITDGTKTVTTAETHLIGPETK